MIQDTMTSKEDRRNKMIVLLIAAMFIGAAIATAVMSMIS